MKSVLLYNCYPKTIWRRVTDSLLREVPHDDIFVHLALPPLWQALPWVVERYFRRFPKVRGILTSPNVPGVGETVGFNAFRRKVDFSQYNIATYIHSKGTSAKHKNGPEIADWTELMRYFVVQRHELCLQAFDSGYSLYGVELSQNMHPSPKDAQMYPDTTFIYEGNFVSINLDKLREPFLTAPCKDQYYGVERFWGTLCSMDQAYCAHYSKTDHYASRYPAERYQTQP